MAEDKGLELTFVDDDRPSVYEVLKKWEAFVSASTIENRVLLKEDELDDVPEDVKLLVLKIRRELTSRGIDPDSIYIADIGFEKDDDKPITLDMKFNYENFEGVK